MGMARSSRCSSLRARPSDKADAEGHTPLYMAAERGHVEVVSRLLTAGASVDKARTLDGATPLFIAAKNGHGVVFSRILAAGASVDKARTLDGATPLVIAAENGHGVVVSQLLAAQPEAVLFCCTRMRAISRWMYCSASAAPARCDYS